MPARRSVPLTGLPSAAGPGGRGPQRQRRGEGHRHRVQVAHRRGGHAGPSAVAAPPLPLAPRGGPSPAIRIPRLAGRLLPGVRAGAGPHPCGPWPGFAFALFFFFEVWNREEGILLPGVAISWRIPQLGGVHQLFFFSASNSQPGCRPCPPGRVSRYYFLAYTATITFGTFPPQTTQGLSG